MPVAQPDQLGWASRELSISDIAPMLLMQVMALVLGAGNFTL